MYPTITVAIVYFSIGLNNDSWEKFPMCILIANDVFWAGAAYGMLISIAIPKIEVAVALTPVLIIPLMIMGGFFVSTDNIPYYFYPFEYISMFKYGF